MLWTSITKSVRLPDLTSIFRAELYALFLAIDVIRRSKLKKNVIFSDSLSIVCKQLPALTLIMILCRNLLKNTQFKQSKEKPLLYVGFQVMSAFLEMRMQVIQSIWINYIHHPHRTHLTFIHYIYTMSSVTKSWQIQSSESICIIQMSEKMAFLSLLLH